MTSFSVCDWQIAPGDSSEVLIKRSNTVVSVDKSMKTPEKEARGTAWCLTFRSKHTFLAFTSSMTFFLLTTESSKYSNVEQIYNKQLNKEPFKKNELFY